MRHQVERLLIDFLPMQEFAADPLIFERGEGIYLWDVEGREYIDGISGVFVVNLGRGNARVIEAITDQLQRLPFGAPTLSATDRMLHLAERLQKITPHDMRTFKFHSGGSEAVEAAIKMARQYHRQTGNGSKYKVVSRYRSYHGATLGALSATGWLPFRTPFEPLLPGFVHVPPPDDRRCKLNAGCPPCQLVCVDLIDEVITREGPETVAAVIVEPVMVMAGGVTSPPGYLEQLREICNRHNVLLIYDEIITAFGRVGDWFAADTFGVWPDLTCIGKGITSGYAPLSAVITSDRVAAAFGGGTKENLPFLSGHTYGGNPVACAAAIAVMDEIEEQGLIERVRKIGAQLLTQLQSVCRDFHIIQEIRGVGLLVMIETTQPHLARRIAQIARRLGLLTLASPEGVVRLGPPFITSEDEIAEITSRIVRAIEEAEREASE